MATLQKDVEKIEKQAALEADQQIEDAWFSQHRDLDCHAKSKNDA
jgi:hypothetical protein